MQKLYFTALSGQACGEAPDLPAVLHWTFEDAVAAARERAQRYAQTNLADDEYSSAEAFQCSDESFRTTFTVHSAADHQVSITVHSAELGPVS